MAKIKTLEYKIGDGVYQIDVRVSSKGIFSAKLPREVYQPLGLNENIEKTSLQELQNTLAAAIKRYREAETTQELFILIRYKANGYYTKKKNGEGDFLGYNDKHLHNGWGSDVDIIGFEFDVAMKETVDGVEKWYNVIQEKNMSWLDNDKKTGDPEKYHKRNSAFSTIHEYAVIPYNEDALANLVRTREVLRQASEALYTIVSQEPDKLLATLTKTNLLTLKNQ